MARKLSKKKKEALYSALGLILVLIIAAILYFSGILDPFLAEPDTPDTPDTPVTPDVPNTPEGELKVHFIDVGQADCILVMAGGEVMLVDTGDTDDDYTDKIIDYLKALNISTIDYLVLTHPDSDHIGGAPEIINGFTVEKCYMPSFVKTTKIFENTLDALEDRSVDVLLPEVGSVFKVGEASCKILAPLEEYDDCNDASIVIRLDFGSRSVLLTGDAEKESEADIVSTYSSADLKVDVLKSGHHGSRTSSSTGLLDKADPEYAVISCGEGNSYGHPHEETIERYESYGITTYRTDLLGTIVLTTDGTSLEFEFEKAS